MYNINTAINIFNLFSKLPVFILTVHAHQHLGIILPNNPYLVFKVRPFHVLAIKIWNGIPITGSLKNVSKNSFKKSLEQN